MSFALYLIGFAIFIGGKAAQGYTDPDSGVLEVERPWCLQPVYQPDPRAVFRGLKVDRTHTTPSGTPQRNRALKVVLKNASASGGALKENL